MKHNYDYMLISIVLSQKKNRSISRCLYQSNIESYRPSPHAKMTKIIDDFQI